METKDDCVFCKIVAGEVSTEKIYENENFFSFPDANPKVKGHSLIIPKEHVKTLLDLEESKGEDLIDAIKETASKIVKENDAKGFNVLNNNNRVAGQVVDHLHFHILPRKEDDGIRVLG